MSTSRSSFDEKRNVRANLLEREETGERLKCSINTSLTFLFYFNCEIWHGILFPSIVERFQMFQFQKNSKKWIFF